MWRFSCSESYALHNATLELFHMMHISSTSIFNYGCLLCVSLFLQCCVLAACFYSTQDSSQYSPWPFHYNSANQSILAGEYFLAPSCHSINTWITVASVNEQISARKTKPEPSLWCEIGHHKGINDGSFQHNCLIMPGRWGTALTRTHCATSPDSPQQKANQCDSLFSSEWEGEWKKENGESRGEEGG